jgi:hypothetical protein
MWGRWNEGGRSTGTGSRGERLRQRRIQYLAGKTTVLRGGVNAVHRTVRDFRPDGQRLGEQNVDFAIPRMIYEAAQQRSFFVREDWRRLQPYVINLLRSSRSQPPFNEFIIPAFDPESGLFVWTGNYLGGSGGVGIIPLIPEDYIL